MSPSSSLRRWPKRNFLAEIDPELRDTHAIDDLAREDVALRRLHGTVRKISLSIRQRIDRAEWLEFADARSALQTAEFELAFNLGFENGLIAGRTEPSTESRGRGGNKTAHARYEALRGEIRQMVAHASIPHARVLAVLLEFSRALAIDAPRGSPSRRPPGPRHAASKGRAAAQSSSSRERT